MLSRRLVMFDTKVDVNEGDKKGNVEKWMLEIEAVMRKSLWRIMQGRRNAGIPECSAN